MDNCSCCETLIADIAAAAAAAAGTADDDQDIDTCNRCPPGGEQCSAAGSRLLCLWGLPALLCCNFFLHTAAAGGTSGINHEALNYAHAAAVVRGCSFPLSPRMRPEKLQQLLPLVGKVTANIIHQLLTTGVASPTS